MIDSSFYAFTDEVVARCGARPSSLIPVLVAIQSEYRYLPAELMQYVADKLGVTRAKVFAVATFYGNFSFEPTGKYVIKLCDGTACHVRKAAPVRDALYKELGVDAQHHSTSDGLFTVEIVSCLGACGLAPTMMINEKVYSKMTPEKVVQIVRDLRKQEEEGVQA